MAAEAATTSSSTPVVTTDEAVGSRLGAKGSAQRLATGPPSRDSSVPAYVLPNLGLLHPGPDLARPYFTASCGIPCGPA